MNEIREDVVERAQGLTVARMRTSGSGGNEVGREGEDVLF